MLQGPPAGRGSQVQTVLPLFTKHWMMWRFIQSNLCSGDLAGHGASSLLSSCAQPCIPLSPCVLAGVQDSPPSPCQGFRPAHCHRLTAPGQIPQGKTPTPCCAGAGEYREAKPPGSHGRVLLGRLPSTSLPRRSAKSFALNPDLQRAGARGSARFWFEERRGPHSALFGVAQRSLRGQVGTFPVVPTPGTLGPGPRGHQVAPGTHGRGRGYPGKVPGEGWVHRYSGKGGCTGRVGAGTWGRWVDRYPEKVGVQGRWVWVPRDGECTGTWGRSVHRYPGTVDTQVPTEGGHTGIQGWWMHRYLGKVKAHIPGMVSAQVPTARGHAGSHRGGHTGGW